jgi:LmbE family N-acetylglucosaminyl deacetylase
LLTSTVDVIRSSLVRGVLTLAAVLSVVAEDSAAARRPRTRPQPLPLASPPIIIADTRLLVVAPHPDDEVLAAGGLMQQVRKAGGQVRVVYLTNGDGYRDGVRLEERNVALKPKDFRGYGRKRQKEASAALAALGLDSDAATFLSFPDQGLSRLTRTYWSERRQPYRSPYTRRDRPPADEALMPDAEYRGEDLTQELAQLIGRYQPTLILDPRKDDQHPDHCAASYFLADALSDVHRVMPEYSVEVLNYIVHFQAWPFDDQRSALPPPPGLGGGASGWIRVPLSPEEVRTKRAALQKYRTQQRAMKWFLDGFVRTNEVFSRQAPAAIHVTLPLRHQLCF